MPRFFKIISQPRVKTSAVMAVSILLTLLLLTLSLPARAGQEVAKPSSPRPIEIKDILAWKSISSARISPDGRWFAYSLTPNEGNSELVIKEVDGTREYRFNLGDAPRNFSALILMSDDSRWVAFMSYPSFEETRKLRQDKKRIEPRASLLELASGQKTDWPGVRKIAFSEQSSLCLAIHRLAPESQEKEKDKWTGSDLVLKNLKSGQELSLGNISEFAFNRSGDRLALLIDARDLAGNGLMLKNLSSNELQVLDSGHFFYKNLKWDDKGQALSVLKGRQDDKYEDKLYGLIAFKFDKKAGPPEKI